MVDRAHLVCVILATATFSLQSPQFYLVISPRTKGRKENRTFTMSQKKTKTKTSDTVRCRHRAQCRVIKGFGSDCPRVEAWRAGAWLSHGSYGLKADAVLQWVFG